MLIFLSGATVPTQILAQSYRIEYDFVESSSPWITSKNPIGLKDLDSLFISDINAYFSKANGGLVNYHQSDNSYQFGGQARSLYRIHKNVVLKGSLDYSNFFGRNMSGSAFIDPYYHLFNITEIDDKNKGNKKLECYHLIGGIAIDLNKGFSMGAEFDFTAGNSTKMKDLRYIGKITDITATIGIGQNIADFIDIGLAYHYNKNIEGLAFNKYSPTAETFEMLISYGSFWGERHTFDSALGVLSSRETPMLNFINGGTLQFSLQQTPYFMLYAQAGVYFRKGQFNLESTSSPVYYFNNSMKYDANIAMVIKDKKKNVHRTDLSFNYENGSNFENIWKKVTDKDGGNYIENIDRKRTNINTKFELRLNHNTKLEVKNNSCKWDLNLGLGAKKLSSDAIIFPYTRSKEHLLIDALAGGRYNFTHKLHTISGFFYAGYSFGLGEPFTDDSYTDSPTQITPSTSELFLNREYEYLCSPKLLFNPKIQYTRAFVKQKFSTYVALDYKQNLALSSVEYLTSGMQMNIQLSIGFIL